ncbi:MAG TPA: hypothetical protein VKV69_00465, partial [Actinomycetota bacterium]|nr:hypothetical protein [Actinomycetota bacterium]
MGLLPWAITIDQAGVWVAQTDGGCVVYTCTKGGAAPPAPRFPGEDAVWRVDPSSDRVVAKIPVHDPRFITAGQGFVMVGGDDAQGVLGRIDEATNSFFVPGGASGPGLAAIAFGDGLVWEADQTSQGKSIGSFDPTKPAPNGESHQLFGHTIRFLAVQGLQVFIFRLFVAQRSGEIEELYSKTALRRSLGSTNPLPVRQIGGQLIVGGRIWLLSPDGYVQAVNPLTEEIIGEMRLGASTDSSRYQWIAYGDGTLWIPFTINGKSVIVRLAPAGGEKEPADAQTPAAGACDAATGDVATVQLNPDVPSPRCVR